MDKVEYNGHTVQNFFKIVELNISFTKQIQAIGKNRPIDSRSRLVGKKSTEILD